MATRLLVTFVRHLRSLNHSFSPSLRSQILSTQFKIIPFFQYPQPNSITSLTSSVPICTCDLRHFSSHATDYSGSEDGDEDEEGDEGEEGESCEDEDGSDTSPKLVLQSAKSEAEQVKEAAEIGYTVVGPLTSSENPFKPYEPLFAIVQIGSHQFKISNGDSIFTERLKYCEVNDKLILCKVLMLGSRSETIIGRPILPDAAVHAVVEEHALDAKVIIFKKKRRKNYRRTKGHRQELTKLRITDIQGIDKSASLSVAA